MDLTAVALAKDNGIPIVVFAQKGKESLVSAVAGKGKFTVID
jgi:uridylate kinase